jgi:L-serine dehydratase
MFLSTFEIFKIGIGPSSSHTMGPMVAASKFLRNLNENELCRDAVRVSVRLHGSLAFTGKGHGTDRAVLLGLLGYEPASLDPAKAFAEEKAAVDADAMLISGPHAIKFVPSRDIIFDFGEPLPGHANGLAFTASSASGATILNEVFYSVGGGFVLTASELARQAEQGVHSQSNTPYPFSTAAEMLAMARSSGLSIAAMKRANEVANGGHDVDDRLDQIWHVMDSCIQRGIAAEGILPGGLSVKRRAASIFKDLKAANQANEYTANEWLMTYAMAVNEENAAGGRIVTAPTNGAAGVLPSVLKYFSEHMGSASQESIRDFLLVASAIGGLIKHNASISGAEVGCQGEVGSASAMAAAGLCAALGGTSEQIENAAEIALEHHLGMTCDPIAGLVQVPCIERNGMGAVKALSAALLALRGDGSHLVPLDNCIETMRQTGRDMSSKYKETSLGGLAVNLPEC